MLGCSQSRYTIHHFRFIRFEKVMSIYYYLYLLDWPLHAQVERAEYGTSKIALRKTKLSSETTQNRLYTDLKNLHDQMLREKELIAVA
jgi:hypothetical protein